ncbi:MAG: hypothetical protein NC121_11165 [Blautia sp.]|nr:hypothetical protein [Blautia sp.]
MKITLGKKDIIWSYVGTIMSMGANLFMLPFLMYYLDGDMLGLWYVFASIGAIATLFDFGFAVTFARNITYCWSGAQELKREDVAFVKNREPDYKLMKQVLVTCRLIYGILSGLVLVLMLTGGTIYIRYVSKEVKGTIPLIAWIIYAFAVTLNLYYGYYASFLRGVGAVERANKNTVYARGIQILLTIGLLSCGAGIIGASIAYLAYGTIFRMLGKYYFYRYQGIKDNLAKISEEPTKKQIHELFIVVWHNAWRDGVISVCNYFCNQASTIICSMFLSLAETGVYSIGVQIASAIAQIAGTLYTAYIPELQAAYINADTDKMKRLMAMIVMSFIYLYITGTIVFMAVGMPVLRIIKPTAVVSIPVLTGLCIYQMILKYRNCYTTYFSCTNRIIYMNGFIVSALLCVILSLFMTGGLEFGVWGLILAQIISQAVYNMWHWSLAVHEELGVSVKDMIRTGNKECVKIVRLLKK